MADTLLSAAAPTGLCGSYRPPQEGFDEMCLPNGRIRPHWQYLSEALDRLGPAALHGRVRESRRLIRDNGMTYTLQGDLQGQGDPQGLSRPWELDLIPLLIQSEEWALIERGLMQRAELLNALLLDLYGARRVLRAGLLPPELILAQNSLILACDGIKVARDRPLVLYAADLARLPDGALCVVADRAQAPSGAGYALENRIVLSRVLPSLFRDSHVHRLAGFFRTLRASLRALAPRRALDSLRIVLLTPGPRNEAYFEHAYLANYLGYTLAQGDDLTVRDGALWLRTLNGLERVDVVLRRVDDDWCDPLELRGDSLLGVPGLLQAVRAGNLTLANALGSRILEHPALAAFLPDICRELLGEELQLPSLRTWWCGRPADRSFVLANLSRLHIRRLHPDIRPSCLRGAQLSTQALRELAEAIRANPSAYVAQEEIPGATVPVLGRDALESRRAILRAFLVAEETGYAVMPGGLTRLVSSDSSLGLSNQLGGLSKDTWVLASEPEREETLIPKASVYSPAIRLTSEVSSRVADNLYWIGRYSERAEGLVRLLRIIVLRANDRLNGSGASEQEDCLRLLLQALTQQTLTFPGFIGEGAEARLANPMPELLSLITELPRVGGLPQTLQALVMAAWSVRDRLSADTWRVVDAIDERLRALTEHPVEQLEDTLDALDPLITALVAFGGLTRENMSHSEGWQFLELGRRLERAVNTTTLLAGTLVPHSGEMAEGMLAEAVLGVTDSLIAYRRGYQSGTRVGALLDLVFQDEFNPRSLAFQLDRLEELVRALPRERGCLGRTRADKLALEAASAIRLADIDRLADLPENSQRREALDALLERIAAILPQLSDEITALYFRHEDRPHSLLARRTSR
ncbi:MAG: circularly permuted type 2 ATP-grasp protein [Chromatiaceae bacterium]|nr:circularly permuted type 2 ATP-grasp protein [Chromatiaceae bacterium]